LLSSVRSWSVRASTVRWSQTELHLLRRAHYRFDEGAVRSPLDSRKRPIRSFLAKKKKVVVVVVVAGAAGRQMKFLPRSFVADGRGRIDFR
jgi:hypothetical protein